MKIASGLFLFHLNKTSALLPWWMTVCKFYGSLLKWTSSLTLQQHLTEDSILKTTWKGNRNHLLTAYNLFCPNYLSLSYRKSNVLSLTPIRMTYHRRGENKYWRRCEETVTLVHCWWVVKWYECYGKQYWLFFKTLNIELLYDSAIPASEAGPWRDICMPVCQKVEATQVSSDIWMNKQSVHTQCKTAQPWKGNPITRYYMDKPWAQWSRSVK